MPKIHTDGRVTEAPGREQSTGERPAPGRDSTEEVAEKREDGERPSAGNSSTASSRKPSSSTKTK